MKTVRMLCRSMCAVMALALFALPAMAQEASDASSSNVTSIFRWINFAIVFGTLVWAFSKFGPVARKRADEISEKIAEGTRAREAAEAQRREVQAKLARVDSDVAQLQADASKAAAAEAQRLRAQAKEEAQNIERAGQAEIAATEAAARLELKEYAGRLAVERAEALLREQMTPAAEAAVFRAFVDKLQESRN
jgi:F-type H+-transporting ATPase subunit b